MVSWHVAHVFSKWLWNSPTINCYYFFSPLYWVFIIIYLKHAMFLVYILLQLFSSYQLHVMLFSALKVFFLFLFFFTLVLPTAGVHCPVWLFSVVPSCRALLLVSLLFVHSTCAVSIYKVFKLSNLLGLFSWSHFCLVKSQHLFTYILISLPRIMMSSLLLWLVLSVGSCWLPNVSTLPSWIVFTYLGICWHKFPCLVILPFPCIC